MPPLVLLVDDDTLLADTLATCLRRHGYTTMAAASGEEGVRLCTAHQPDVALVDLRLPGLDGLAVLRRLRVYAPGTAVVLLTAYSSVTTAVDAIRYGALNYLCKPLDPEALRHVVEQALRRSQR